MKKNPRKQVLIRIDEDLNERWNKVSKKLNMTKSSIVEDFLRQVMPIFEKEEPKDVLSAAFKELGTFMHETGSLFDDVEK